METAAHLHNQLAITPPLSEAVEDFYNRPFQVIRGERFFEAIRAQIRDPRVLGMLAHTAEVELSCDEVFELLDQFAEMALRGETVAELMPLVQHHLEMCPECREEYEALRRVLERE